MKTEMILLIVIGIALIGVFAFFKYLSKTKHIKLKNAVLINTGLLGIGLVGIGVIDLLESDMDERRIISEIEVQYTNGDIEKFSYKRNYDSKKAVLYNGCLYRKKVTGSFLWSTDEYVDVLRCGIRRHKIVSEQRESNAKISSSSSVSILSKKIQTIFILLLGVMSVIGFYTFFFDPNNLMNYGVGILSGFLVGIFGLTYLAFGTVSFIFLIIVVITLLLFLLVRRQSKKNRFKV